MSDERKVVRGGFRATLALLLSIIAIILALMAYSRTGGDADLNAQIKELKAKMEKMKKETSETVDKVREETTKALEKIGVEINKE
jgi:hypothetical protein